MATIAGTIRTHPHVLVIGMIGFALRGGIFLLTLPVLVLPTSVEVRLLLGDSIGTSGLTSTFYVIVGAVTVVSLALALLLLYVLARCELASFTRFVNSNEPGTEHAWPPPGHPSADERSGLTSRLFVVQSLTLLAILVAVLPLAAGITQSTYQEIVLPSSADSLYARIFTDVAALLAVFVVALVFIEAISALATRRVLSAAFGLKAYNRMSHHPLRVIGVGVVGWALFIGAVAISYVVLTLVWQAVESVFLSTGLSGDLRDIVSAVLVALLFGAVFSACLFVCGLVSTVRSGLWTLASLR